MNTEKMTNNSVKNELEKINLYLAKCLWMDFEFCRMDAGEIVLAGSIDHSFNRYDIEIIFEQPHFVSSLLFWHTDTSKAFIQLVSETEERELNDKYRIERGNFIFQINVEGFENPPIFIAAKKISYKIFNENPFCPVQTSNTGIPPARK